MSRRIHILVVDDDGDLRDTLRDVLEEVGYAVTSAADGADALDQLRDASQRPDMILLDLQMPNMDGEAFRGEQLKLADVADIPVAVLTSDKDGKRKAAALHTAACLSKPLKLLQLLTLIPRVVEEPAAPDKPTP
jgi:CheY-like chemotaxis protein